MANIPRSPFVLVRLPSIQLKELDLLNEEKIISHEKEYDLAVQKARVGIQKMSNKEDLLNGLLFSSHTFLEGLKKYFQKDPKDFNKKAFQVERRALSYLHRMTFNASPLSSFSKVQLRDNDWKYINPLSDSMVIPNTQLLSRYEQELFKERLLDEVILLKLNPFVQHKEELFTFLQFKGEVGIEIIRLEANEALFALYNEVKFKSLSLINIQNELINIIEADEDAALSIVLDLIKIQFLVPAWEAKDLPVKDGLVNLFEKENEYELKMKSKFQSSTQLSKSLIPVPLLKNPEKVKATQRFYEHCFDRKEIERPEFDQATIELEIVQLYEMVQSCIKELNTNYGGLSLLEAFEVWDLKIKINLNELSLLRVGSAYELILDKASKSMKPEQLGIMLRPIPNYSKSLLISWTTGFGKYIRKFLPNYHEEDLEEIYNWIKDSKNNLVQNIDRSLHPANELYDDLAHIELFNLQSDSAKSRKVKVQLDIQGNLVDLRKGQRIETVDLGIQNPANRSAFYNFMNHFSSYRNYLQYFLDDLYELLKEVKENYTFYPRVETPNLILRMASWKFEKKENLIGNNLSGFEQFKYLRALQNKLDCSRIVSFHFEEESGGFIDFNNPISIESFVRKVKKKEGSITLRNLLCEDQNSKTPNNFAEYYWEFKPEMI